MAEWVMDSLTGNMMNRGSSPAEHVVKGDVDTLVRETGQNAKDQIRGKGPVRLRYTLIELSGTHKAEFLKAMGWPELRKHVEACTEEPGESGVRLKRGLATVNSEKPLRCLRIEDFGTHGLQGGDFDKDGNFCLLCRAEFKTSSVPGRGGSYGLGKQVLWKASAVATVMLSSVVEGLEGKGIRVFGRTDIPSHSVKGDRDYQSGGWFGEKKKNKGADGTSFAASVFGAKTLAQSLLLDRQYDKSSGTSALIVGFQEANEDEVRDLDKIAEDIIASSERWFWPSMTGKHPSMEFEISIERDGKQIFSRKADPLPKWEPFIRAREAAVSGTAAKMPGEIAEASIDFKVPSRELPAKQAHGEFTASLKLRATRGDESLADHEKANCVAVFRGAEMVVKYFPSKRPPLDNVPFFGILLTGKAAGTGTGARDADEFFRAAEPPLHDDWEYTPAVKHSFKAGAKQRLNALWNSLQDKVFKLIDENVAVGARGPDLLAKLFPFGHSVKKPPPKQATRTRITSTQYLGGKWRVEGIVSRAEPNTKAWEARIGFVGATDSGPGEHLLITKLVTKDKGTKIKDFGPPATVLAQASVDDFKFEAVLEPPPSLKTKDLDLTAIRFSH